MIKKLAAISNSLDEIGFLKEANELDIIILELAKAASSSRQDSSRMNLIRKEEEEDKLRDIRDYLRDSLKTLRESLLWFEENVYISDPGGKFPITLDRDVIFNQDFSEKTKMAIPTGTQIESVDQRLTTISLPSKGPGEDVTLAQAWDSLVSDIRYNEFYLSLGSFEGL
jgi:hypothetical protein